MAFTLIAHRGYSDLAPENTCAAFDLALERGFPQLERDAQLTRDGVPVVIHDPLLDRTTTGSWPLRTRTLAEVQALSAGEWFGPAFAAERIPTLDAVLARYAGRAWLHLELKSEEQELAVAVAELLLLHGWGPGADAVPRLMVTSFHVEHLYRWRCLLPAVPHGWLLGRITGSDIELAATLGLAEICPRAETLSAPAIANAAARGRQRSRLGHTHRGRRAHSPRSRGRRGDGELAGARARCARWGVAGSAHPAAKVTRNP